MSTTARTCRFGATCQTSSIGRHPPFLAYHSYFGLSPAIRCYVPASGVLNRVEEDFMRNEKPDRPYNVLFLCTGNSARSILGEALLNRIGKGKFVAHSASSQHKGVVNPHALSLLRRLGYATDGYRSKNWEEFTAAGAPHLGGGGTGGD